MHAKRELYSWHGRPATLVAAMLPCYGRALFLAVSLPMRILRALVCDCHVVASTCSSAQNSSESRAGLWNEVESGRIGAELV